MRWLVVPCPVLICVILNGAILRAQGPVKFQRDDPDYQRFLGNWKVVSMTKDGVEITDGIKSMQFTNRIAVGAPEAFSGYRLKVEEADGAKADWAYAIHSVGPRTQLRLMHRRIHQATYEFNQETLTLFVAEEGKDLPRILDRKTKGITVLELRRLPWVRNENPPDVITQLVTGRDNQLLFTGRSTGVLQLWSLPHRKELARWPGHTANIVSLAASRDMKRGLSVDVDGRVRLWDLERKEEIRSWQALGVVDDYPALATISNDGKKVYLAQGYELLELDADTGQRRRSWKLSWLASCLDISPDGDWLAIGDVVGFLHRYPLREEGPPAVERLRGFSNGKIQKLRFSATGDEIYLTWEKQTRSGFENFLETIFTFGLNIFADKRAFPHRLNLTTRHADEVKVLSQFSFRRTRVFSNSVDFSADGKSLVLWEDRNLWLCTDLFSDAFEARKSLAQIRLLAQDQTFVRAWIVGSEVVAASSDGGLIGFDPNATPRVRLLTLPKTHPGTDRNIFHAVPIFSADGERIYGIGPTRQVQIWDRNGRYMGELAESKVGQREVDKEASFGLLTAPSSKGVYRAMSRRITDLSNNPLQVRHLIRWPPMRGPLTKSVVPDFVSAPLQLGYFYGVLPNEKHVFGEKVTADGSRNGLAVWEMKTGRILKAFGHADLTIAEIAVSPDGVWGLTQDEGSHRVRVWNLAKGQFVHVLEPPNNHAVLPGMGFTSRGELVTCTRHLDEDSKEPGLLCVWNLKTGELIRRIVGADHQFFTVARTADLAITNGRDGLKVWDLNTGKLRAVCLETQFLSGPVSVSPDGRQVVTLVGGQPWIVDWEKPPLPWHRYTPLPRQAEQK
jgi:WD40 repeat protein